MENLHEIKSLLAIPKDIVITTHRNPDGDAIGSSLAVYHYLKNMGHNVKIISPSEYPDFLEWMPAVHDIMIFDVEPEESQRIIEYAQIIFYLDFNALDRIDKVGELTDAQRCTKIMIDHHLYPDPMADYLISDTTASSTCELVYDFIERLGDKQKIDKTIAECIFTGILTDTGSFKYSTSPKVFRLAAELVELGVDDHLLQDLIFNSLQEKYLRLLGYCLNRRMEILEEYHTGIITLSKEDYELFDIQRGDTEGIVNYLLQLKQIKVAAFITEQPTIVKLSLRSKGDFSVQEIAKKHFKGGGHKNAAGGYSFQNLKITVRKFKEILPDYKEQLME